MLMDLDECRAKVRGVSVFEIHKYKILAKDFYSDRLEIPKYERQFYLGHVPKFYSQDNK